MNNGKWIIVAICAALFAVACAAGPKPPPPPPGSLAAILRTDAALFKAGCDFLNHQDKPTDLQQARLAFETLIQRYPKSRWQPQASSYIMLIDELLYARKKAEDGLRQTEVRNEEIRNLREELEQLKKENRQLRERMSELGRLQQENEQLRRDMELLKKLEIEILNRERRLR